MTKASLRGHNENYFKVEDRNCLGTAVVYKANASGKSDFLKAFGAIEYLV